MYNLLLVQNRFIVASMTYFKIIQCQSSELNFFNDYNDTF